MGYRLSLNEKEVESPHSVEISINASGKFSGKVKTYGKTPKAALRQTTDIVKMLEILIKEKNQVNKCE